MSWDVLVGSTQAPTAKAIAEWAWPASVFERATDAADASGVVKRRSGGKLVPAFLVYGPERVAAGDFEALPRARFRTELSVPLVGGQEGVALALALAERLATDFDGGWFDPQSGTVWPEHELPIRKRASKIYDVAVLDFRFLATRPAEALMVGWLDVVRDTFPKLEPKRKPADPHEDTTFATRRPCFGAVFGTGRKAEARRPPGATWVTSLSLAFDLARSETLESVVAHFRETSRRLEPFYATASVRKMQREHGEWATVDMDEAELEAASGTSSDLWRGLPVSPAWLTWFGRAYASELRDVLGDGESTDEGVFFRASPEPLPSQSIKRYPAIPAEYCLPYPHGGAQKIPSLE